MTLKINIEIPVVLLFFAINFSGTITTNFIIYRTCHITLKYNESDCALLGVDYTDNATAELEQMVQPYATRIFTSTSIIEAIFAPMMCFFLGPWSDRYGRKPVLLLTLSGMILGGLIKIIISAIPNISPWYVLLSLLPSCIAGGVPAALTAVLCYITDTTTQQERAVKFYIFEGLIGLTTIIGNLTSSLALLPLGYTSIFSISTGCIMTACIYVLLFIPESIREVETEGKLTNLFSATVVKTTTQTIFKKRENYSRGLLLTILFLLTIYVFTMIGESGVIFLYLRGQFSWDLQKYTTYTSIIGVTCIIGGVTSVCVLYKLLRFRETIVIIISLISCMVSGLYQGLAVNNVQFYVGGAIKGLGTAISPMARSILSKVIPIEDSGKVFSVLTTLETVGALLGTTAYTAFYNWTMLVFAPTFFFLSFGMYFTALVSVSLIMILQRYRSGLVYNEVAEDS